MSDAKPKRATREPTYSETVAEEQTADAAAMPAAAGPAPVSETAAIALATAALPAPLQPAAPAASAPPRAGADDAWRAFAEMQSVLARACEEVAAEVGGFTRSGIAAGTDAALALLGARTFAEAVEINAGLVRRRFDAMIEGSAKLSEIGVKAMAAASRPVLTQLSASWSAAGRG